MLEILCLLFSRILFSSVVFVRKELRGDDVNSLSILAIYIFTVPFLILFGFYLYNTTNVPLVFSIEYIFYILLWLAVVFLATIGTVFIIKYESLVELSSYTLGFSTLFAILLDIFFLKTTYNFLTFIAIILFLISGFCLTHNKKNNAAKYSLIILMGMLIGISLLDALDVAIYKKGMLFQSNILFHAVICYSLLYTIFFILGYKSLIRDIKSQIILPKHILIITIAIIIFIFCDLYAISKIPVSFIILSSIVSILLYSLYDFKTNELKLNMYNGIALLFLICGIVFLSVQ